MDAIDDPGFTRKISEIRERLQKLGTSYSEEELSDDNKSREFDNESDFKPYTFLSPRIAKSKIDKPIPNAFAYSKQQSDAAELKAQEEQEKRIKCLFKPDGFKEKIKVHDVELQSLKAVNEELERQVETLHEILQSKEKELNKLVFERDLRLKDENSFKKQIEELSCKECIMTGELKEAKEIRIKLESDNKELLRLLREAKSIDKMKTATKAADDQPQNLRRSSESSVKSPNFQVDFKKFDFQRLRIPERMLSSPDPVDLPYTERGEDSYKTSLADAMKLLNANTPRELYQCAQRLKHTNSKYKKSKTLVDRISEMIIQCSPEGTFKEKPRIKQIWRWITRLLEEYMKLKQSLAAENFAVLARVVGAESMEEIVQKVMKLVKNKHKNSCET